MICLHPGCSGPDFFCPLMPRASRVGVGGGGEPWKAGMVSRGVIAPQTKDGSLAVRLMSRVTSSKVPTLSEPLSREEPQGVAFLGCP